MKPKRNNHCPLCRGRSELYLDFKKVGKGSGGLYRCQKCQLIYVYPAPEKDFLEKFYATYDSIGEKENYYHNVKNYRRSREGKRLEIFFKEISEKYSLNKNLPVLDLGSGAGVFLDILKNSDYKGFGLEISQRAVDFAKNNFQVECQKGDTLEADFEKESFGAVFMWDLLEHLNDQGKMIKKINEWLTPDGYLILEVPTAEALINKLVLFLSKMSINWPASWLFGYHHLFIHSRISISVMLEKNGFKILNKIRKNTPAVRIFPWSIKYFLPRLVLEFVNLGAIIFKLQNKLIIIAQKTAL